MKTIIAVVISSALMSVSYNALALRCGNELVNEGDSALKVQRLCNIEQEYQVQNENADINYKGFKQNGMNYELKFLDGKLNEINESRF